MSTRIFSSLLALLLAIGLCSLSVQAEEKKAETDTDTAKIKVSVEKAESDTDTAKIKVSEVFLNRWKKMRTLTKRQAYEIEQTRTVAGVRGVEAEDTILDQLYYKGGARYPSRVDLKNAIVQLKEAIEADPKGEGVPEMKLFVAECHSQLGEAEQAQAVYKDLVDNHPDTEAAKQAKGELKKPSKEE